MPIPPAEDISDKDKLLVQEHVGSALVCMYEDTVSEALPDKIIALLELLAAQDTRNE